MIRRSARASVSVLVLTAWLAGAAADDVLKIIPDNALALSMVHRLAETSGKLQKMAQLMQAPAISVLDQAKSAAGVAKGVDDKGTAAILVMPGKSADADPRVLLAVPVTDYRQFIGQLSPAKPEEKVTEVEVMNRKFLAGSRDGYAVFAETGDRQTLEQVLTTKQSLAGHLAELDSWLAENDVAFVATRAGVQFFAAKAQQGLKKAAEQFSSDPDDPMAAMRSAFDIYAGAVRVAEQEVSLAAIGIHLNPDSTLRVTSRVRFTKGGEAAKCFAGVKPATGDLLAGLPKGPFIVAFGGTLPKSLTEAAMTLSTALIKKNPKTYGMNPEQAEKLAKLSAKPVESVHSVALVMKTAKRSDPIYSNMFGILRVDHAAGMLDTYEKQIADTNKVIKEAKGGMLRPMTVKRTRVGGKPALEMEMTIPFPKASQAMPSQQKMMELMFGVGGRLRATLVAADEHTVVLGYNAAKDAMDASLEAAKTGRSGLSAESDVAATTALLSPRAQWIGYVSPAGYVNLMDRIIRITMAAMSDGGAAAVKFHLPPFPKSPSIGVAAKASPEEIRGELVVPAAVFKAIGEYGSQIRQGLNKPEVP